ncbi:MAG: hypothetical protein ABIP82_04875, partial [Nitrospirales bacterium]
HPVLILEDFLKREERKILHEAMARSKWNALADIPPVAQAFHNCGKSSEFGLWIFRCCPPYPTGRNVLHCRLR